jgi:Holliday junction resolvase
MTKRSRGRRGRRRAEKPERQLVALFQEWGLEARRVELDPGSGEPGPDPDIYKIGREAPVVGRCKTPSDGLGALYAWLDGDGADYLALRAEGAEWLFVLPERVMRELLTQ